VIGAVIVRDLIEDLGVIFERAKAVQESRRHPQLCAFAGIESHSDMAAVSGRAFPKINRDIED
jgi:hypothetical protein